MGDYKTSTSPQGPPLPKIKASGVNLLSLDGGGVKGVSSLVVLKEVMERVRALEINNGSTNKAERKPVDYFELAAGTSTGGLIALMLFRLRMTVSECLEEYYALAKNVFAPTILWQPITRPGLLQTIGKSWLWTRALTQGAMYDNKRLVKAIDTCVREHGLDYSDQKDLGESKLIHSKSGMMFMCTTLAAKGESVLLRSYPQPTDAQPTTPYAREASKQGYMNSVNVRDAALATSAAPFFLPEVHWNPLHLKGNEMVFWDGGMLNNNPIMQLWNARYDLVAETAPAPKVNCVLSLGCSYDTILPFRWTQNPVVRAFMCGTFLTNTAAKDHDFAQFVQRMQGREDENCDLRYYRFDADTRKEFFAIDDAGSMGRLKDVTERWLVGSENVQRELDECARRLVM